MIQQGYPDMAKIAKVVKKNSSPKPAGKKKPPRKQTRVVMGKGARSATKPKPSKPAKPADPPPSVNGANGAEGRDAQGRFTKGNSGGPGNPHVSQTAKLRAALLEAVTPEDIREIALKMVKNAKAGNMIATKELLERTIGPAKLTMDLNVQTPSDGSYLDNLPDEELAQMIIDGGLELPPILAAKIKLQNRDKSH
jgi:hypothetical protein